MSVAIPALAVRDAQEGAARAGYPGVWQILLALAGPESGYNPRPPGYNDDGSSFGYLQLHVGGLSALFPGAGMGDGHATAELLDGPSNMAIGAAHVGAQLAAGRSVAEALAPWSTRPAALALLERIQTEGIATEGGDQGAGGGDVPGGGASTVLVPLAVVAFVAFVLLG